MAPAFNHRVIALACAASLALPFSGAFALEAHSEGSAEAAGKTETFEVTGNSVTALLPCDTPASSPADEGSQSSVCIMGDLMFVFAASAGAPTPSSGPLASDFDAAYEEVQSSSDTDSIEEVQENGRRVLNATRNPVSGYGVVKIVEVAPGALVYAIAMSRPNDEQPLSEMEQQGMRDFVASMEINP